MAKLKSLIKLEGTLDGLTFYKTKDGYLVRTKGGISKERMRTDAAFARTRENGSEFGHCARMGKLLRRAMLDLLADAKDSRSSTRLMQYLSKVKNTDTISVRGQRNVSNGLGTLEGKQFLKGFDFNIDAPLGSVLLSAYTLDTVTGGVSIVDFIPNQHLYSAGGATHVGLRSGFLNLDFDSGISDVQLSPVTELPINGISSTVNLLPSVAASGTGYQFYFLKVSFLQEINGVLYPLHNGNFNSLQLLEVV